jgi:tetratricopeptide (TPR) repeat protein
MKNVLWIKYLSAVLAFSPLIPVNMGEVLAAEPIYVAQADSAYDRYMQLGYAATQQRNYQTARNYFQQALQVKPGDFYATAAAKNVTGYVNRSRGGLTFISGAGRPSRRVSGASRGEMCVPAKKMPVAIIPQTEPQLTASDHPTFFFFVPQNSAQALEFVLEADKTEEPFYKTTWKPTLREPALVSVSLPVNKNLQVGKNYNWKFSVVCDQQVRDKDLSISSVVKYMQPDQNLKIQLQKAPASERATLYAASGFWQDTITTVADLRRQHPRDITIKTDWEDLLKSVDLQEFAQVPLVP